MAYVFLLLSASALFAQIVALVQHVANPLAVGLQGVAGGIIGLELQARLAQLLTKWGNVAFLTVFVLITATFAFNIHWQALYHKLTRLIKVSSSMKSQDTFVTQDTIEDSDQQRQTESMPLVTENKDLVISKLTRSKADFGQLPLELQPQESALAVENNDGQPRFGHVLTDFLSKSGLGASVKATMVAATEAAAVSKLMSDNLQTAAATPSHARTAHNTNISINQSTANSRKVEPSFTWNDANTVDDLLAHNEFTTTQPSDATEAVISYQHDDNVSADGESLSATVDTMKLPSQIHTSQVDELADSWIAEHGFTEEERVITATSIVEPAVPNRSTDVSAQIVAEHPVKDTIISSAPSAMTPQVVAPAQEETEWNAPQQPAPVISEHALVTDMTPTNTPPANPKLPPIAATKPMMSFELPDSSLVNHIEDMMPEDHSAYDSADDELQAPAMPEIHDDAAFSNKSRSMQTAQYRAQLTPIPEFALLDKPDPNRKPSYTVAELEQLSELLEIKLQEFNVKANVVNAIPGPVVTRFEVELAAGIKASKVTGISRDLARSLSMASLRVVEVIPGKPYIGIEVPNKQREMVRLIELLDTDKFRDPKAQISMAMGKDIGGNAIITDLARAPHMLVAGTTGSGKSVLVNSMLLSMLLKYTPNELRLILIDPKQLELANYNDIPHLLTPVVTDMTEAASALSWCVAEMERRYQLMSLLKVRKLNEFNKKIIAAEKAGKPMLDPLWRPNDNVSIDQAPKIKTLPMTVIVADEFADMIMQVGKQAEELITRLAQKSRAAGIHLMLATQRPSVDVITGLIKANIPVRAALRVNSRIDSRTILDSGGAEDMLGNGDMLFLGPGQIEPDRVHGAYVSDEEVNRVCDAWRERGAPDYIDNMAGNFELSSSSNGNSGGGSASGEDDDLYNEAVSFIMETRKVSASSIQRKFSIGYNRAARIVDSMEEAGLVSSMGKSGKRELLM